MNNSKQLDCELKCTATAQLQCCVEKELCRQDKSIASLLEETNETKEYKQASDRTSE